VTFSLGHLLYLVWSYVVVVADRVRVKRVVSVCGHRTKGIYKERIVRPAAQTHFTGFLGLVGKEPDVERGLLIDTGASINIHGADWFNRFVEKVLNPWSLWSSEFQVSGMKVTGVEGNSVGMDLGKVVPGNIRGVDKETGETVNISISFKSQQGDYYYEKPHYDYFKYRWTRCSD